MRNHAPLSSISAECARTNFSQGHGAFWKFTCCVTHQIAVHLTSYFITQISSSVASLCPTQNAFSPEHVQHHPHATNCDHYLTFPSLNHIQSPCRGSYRQGWISRFGLQNRITRLKVMRRLNMTFLYCTPSKTLMLQMGFVKWLI